MLVCASSCFVCSIHLYLYQLTHKSPLNDPSKWELHEAPYQINSQRVLWYDVSDPEARLEQMFYAFEAKKDKGGLGLTR